MTAQQAKDAGYLCMPCAEKLGGTWPDGHRATFHGGVCPICNKPSGLACWDDWNWLDSRLGKEARQHREL